LGTLGENFAMSFRFNSKSFFLTYPQCEAPKEELMNHLDELSELEWCVVSREQHEDGNYHLHAVGQFITKVNWRNPNCFDYLGFHPNIQSPRNLKAVIEYVCKDGDTCSKGTRPTTQVEKIELLANARDLSKDQFFEYCVEKKVGYSYYKEALNIVKTTDNTITSETPNNGVISQDLFFLRPHQSKTTVVIGPTGCGKTTWAKTHCLKPALFCSHVDDLKELKAGYHKSIILDDMIFTHWPVQSQIHLLDTTDPRSIHVRYGIVKIPSGIQKIMTCNERPVTVHEAIERRIKIINLL